MTKCALFWKKVQEFKEKDDFKGFMEWCGYKSYEQARKDWNAFDTLLLIAKKVAEPVCEIVGKYKLSEDALEPIIHQRKDLPTREFGKRETIPSPVQERAIEHLLPKIKAGARITEEDSKQAVKKALGEEAKTEPKAPSENATAPTPKIEVDTGFKFECPVCHGNFLLIHVDPEGKHRFQEVIVA